MDQNLYEMEEQSEREVLFKKPIKNSLIFSVKKIKIMINGDSTSFVLIKISKNASFREMSKCIEEKLDWNNHKTIRLFSTQGVEIFQDDLDFLKSGATLYVSKGEDFDQNSCFSEYEIVKTLGEGGFGKVVLGIHKITKKKFAIKIVNNGMIGNAMDIDMVFREAETLKSLNHKNIVKIYNCFTLKNMQVVFVMEYLEGGELLKYLTDRKTLSEEEARHFFTQIVDAISYVHKEFLIHRDLKLENLLLSDTENRIIKVVDFGIAGILSNLNVDNIHAGTLKYLAPEVFEKRSSDITPALDVWAMGCILFALVTGTLPFRGTHTKNIVDKIKNSPVIFPENFEERLSEEIKDLIYKCMDKNPKIRITMNEIADHPWILGIKFQPRKTLEVSEENKAGGDENEKQRLFLNKVGFSSPKKKELIGRYRSESFTHKNVKSPGSAGLISKKFGFYGDKLFFYEENQGSPLGKTTFSPIEKNSLSDKKKGSLFNIKIESLNSKVGAKTSTMGNISHFKK